MSTETLPALHGIKVGDKLALCYRHDKDDEVYFRDLVTVSKVGPSRIYINSIAYDKSGRRNDRPWDSKANFLRIPTESDLQHGANRLRKEQERKAERERREAIRATEEMKLAASICYALGNYQYNDLDEDYALVKRIGVEKLKVWLAEIEAAKASIAEGKEP